ncbi:MAG: TVP38/TMEM64 family protein [Candidatus Heimdallarchaeota archaeon]|nr:TVP38/TMEM64 family protein [Candidatus Heimdallarchaeota archaeon]
MVDVVSFLENYDSTILVILILGILILEVFLLSFPKEIVMLYAGLVFGIYIGGIINLIGLFGAAVLGYEGGYYGRFGLEERRKHPVLQKYQDRLDNDGIKALIIFRIFPFTPNDILSISSGFVKLKRTPYLLITFITAIPYAFFIAYVGSEKLDTLKDYVPEAFDPVNWLVSFVIVIIIAVYLIKRGTIGNNQ